METEEAGHGQRLREEPGVMVGAQDFEASGRSKLPNMATCNFTKF